MDHVDVDSRGVGTDSGAELVKLLTLELFAVALADLLHARVHEVVALLSLPSHGVRRLATTYVKVSREPDLNNGVHCVDAEGQALVGFTVAASCRR